MEPLENRALLAVDAFGVSASLAESNVGESWGPDPEPAAFSASVLATDAAVVDVSGVNVTLADASFSVQSETPEPVAPPSFDQLMESLGMIEIESLDDESDAASASYLDEAASATQLLDSLNLQDVSQGTPRQVVFYDSSAADFDASTLNLDDESVYYVDAANANADGAASNSITPCSVDDPSACCLTTSDSLKIYESVEFTGSGGSGQGPYFGFTTSDIPSGYWAYVRFKGGDAVYGDDYVVRCATIDDNGVVTPNMNYVSGGSNPDGSYDIYVYGSASYSVVPINDSVLESNETVVAEFYLVDMQSGGADYDPIPILCDSFTATICQAPEFLTDNDANIINTDVRDLGFIYDKPEVGDVVSIPGGLNLETNGRAVTYSLESSESSEYFEINSATGEISWKTLPENQTYDFTLTVKATDSACAQQYDTLQLSFTYGWASFVLCVDTWDSNEDGSGSSSGIGLDTGHAFWIIEGTSSLCEYCETIYNASNPITISVVDEEGEEKTVSYSFNDVKDNNNQALGFWAKAMAEARGVDLGIAGTLCEEENTQFNNVDAYSISLIPDEARFAQALAYAEYLRESPGTYDVAKRNCVTVASQEMPSYAGVTIQTSTKLPYTLYNDLLDSNKSNNGVSGGYTPGASLDYC